MIISCVPSTPNSTFEKLACIIINQIKTVKIISPARRYEI